MKYLVSAALIVVGLIHLAPMTGAFGPAWLEKLYGLPIGEPNLEILMRHRAILFGLLGAFLIAAAFKRELQAIAFAAGLVSVASFVWLAWSVGGYNPHLERVVTVDLVALASLGVGGAAYLFRPKRD